MGGAVVVTDMSSAFFPALSPVQTKLLMASAIVIHAAGRPVAPPNQAADRWLDGPRLRFGKPDGLKVGSSVRYLDLGFQAGGMYPEKLSGGDVKLAEHGFRARPNQSLWALALTKTDFCCTGYRSPLPKGRTHERSNRIA